MEKINEIRAQIRRDIKDLDGGYEKLAEKLQVHANSIKKTLNERQTIRPRLETITRIRTKLDECLSEQNGVLSAMKR